MILNRRRALLLVGIAEVPFPVAHDQQALHAFIGGALFHFGEVLLVLRLVLEKLVDVLDPLDPQRLRGLREIEIVELARADRAVQRPLRQRNPEQRRGSSRGCGKQPWSAEQASAAAAVDRNDRRDRATDMDSAQ